VDDALTVCILLRCSQKSLNGTYVNSTRIESHALQDGDVVQFGGAAKLKCGERLLVSGGSITYRFVGGTSSPSSKKRKVAAIATPAPASCARHDEVQELTNKVNKQQKQIQ
jgi:pSer/pThr/pTyr-binding forkhead associated (FHA) protein